MKTKVILISLTGILLAAGAFCADGKPVKGLIESAVPPEFWNRGAAADGPVKGYVDWKERYRRDASEWDKTDYWAAIAVSQEGHHSCQTA